LYDLRGNAFNPLALPHLHIQSEATLESLFNNHVGEKLCIPSTEEDLKRVLCPNQTENHLRGYIQSEFKPNMFSFNLVYTLIFVLG
jgi:hypothetical protein